MRFQNECNKVAIELQVVQFWSEIILVISNRTRVARMISDQIALHSVQLPLHINFIYLQTAFKKVLRYCKFKSKNAPVDE